MEVVVEVAREEVEVGSASAENVHSLIIDGQSIQANEPHVLMRLV